MRPLGRTWVVLLLMIAAIGVPLLAWWVSGSREADRESLRLRFEARVQCETRATALAQRLAERLERLRATENARPFYQYQNLYHDPRGASEGLSVVPSPLASGPSDPLVFTHFQATEDGRLTIPTLNEEVKSLNAPDAAKQGEIRAMLAAAAPQILTLSASRLADLKVAVGEEQRVGESVTTRSSTPEATASMRNEPPLATPIERSQPAANASPSPLKGDAPSPLPQNASGPQAGAPPPTLANDRPASQKFGGSRKLPDPALQNANATQNVKLASPSQKLAPQSANTGNTANTLLPQENAQKRRGDTRQLDQSSSLQQSAVSQAVTVQTLDPSSFSQNLAPNQVYRQIRKEPPRRELQRTVVVSHTKQIPVHTGDFSWQTIDVGGHPALAAIRPVATPAGASVQGFVLSSSALRDWLQGGTLARSRSFAASASDAFAAVGETGWWVAVDERPLLAAAAVEGDARRRSFRRAFGAGLAGALVAIVVVAALMWQTERLARERARFAAAAAHELRTPISSLRLYGEMLGENLGDPARSGEYARQIGQQAERLGRVVSNMLEYSRLERGPIELDLRASDLGSAVNDCVEQLRGALAAAGCTVAVACEQDLAPVRFDRDAVFHIVQNLADNAEKYSRRSADRSIGVAVRRRNGAVELSVEDRGAGMPPELLRARFRPFRRGGRTDDPAGLGLGLSLTAALAHAQGATLAVAQRDGGGTIVTIAFPS